MYTRNLRNQLGSTSKTIAAAALSCMLLASCGGSTKTESDTEDSTATSMESDTAAANTLKPAGPAPAWAPDIKPEMQAVIEKLGSYGDKPIPQLTAQEARKNHTPTDAVMDLVKENNIPMPAPMVDTMSKMVSVKGGNIPVRIYTPKTGTAPFPVIVYYHGGGFVIADLDVYDASAKGLAEQTGAVVVSVAYRLSPEHKFPTAHDDAYAAYLWTVKNVVSIKGDPKKIALAGESAGGNLAANVSIMARDKGAAMPVHQLLVYPVAGNDMNTESYKKYAAAKPLDKPMMEWFVKNYLKTDAYGIASQFNLVPDTIAVFAKATIDNILYTARKSITIGNDVRKETIKLVKVVPNTLNDLKVTALDANKEPVAGATICLFRGTVLAGRDICEGSNYSLTTDANGVVNFKGLEAVEYYVLGELRLSNNFRIKDNAIVKISGSARHADLDLNLH